MKALNEPRLGSANPLFDQKLLAIGLITFMIGFILIVIFSTKDGVLNIGTIIFALGVVILFITYENSRKYSINGGIRQNSPGKMYPTTKKQSNLLIGDSSAIGVSPIPKTGIFSVSGIRVRPSTA